MLNTQYQNCEFTPFFLPRKNTEVRTPIGCLVAFALLAVTVHTSVFAWATMGQG